MFVFSWESRSLACDGLVERFNRMLKTALQKRAADCGDQWDRYLSGVVWACRNVPHESTGEKPSFLLFGMDPRSPTEAALLPPSPLTVTDVVDYRDELVFLLSTARTRNMMCMQPRIGTKLATGCPLPTGRDWKTEEIVKALARPLYKYKIRMSV